MADPRAIAAMPGRDRPTFGDARGVLTDLTRWSRQGTCDSTTKQLADAGALSARTVKRCLAALRAAGLITDERRGGSAAVGTRRTLVFLVTSDRTARSRYVGPRTWDRVSTTWDRVSTTWNRVEHDLGPRSAVHSASSACSASSASAHARGRPLTLAAIFDRGAELRLAQQPVGSVRNPAAWLRTAKANMAHSGDNVRRAEERLRRDPDGDVEMHARALTDDPVAKRYFAALDEHPSDCPGGCNGVRWVSDPDDLSARPPLYACVRQPWPAARDGDHDARAASQ